MGNLPANSPGKLPGLIGPNPADLRATAIGKAPGGAAQAKPASGQVQVHAGGRTPRLKVVWGRRRDHWVDDLRALLHGPWPKLPRKLRFHDSWRPRRHFAIWFSFSTLAHVLMIVLPLPFWLAITRPVDLRQPRDVQLTWSGPVKDLPSLGPRSSAPKRAEPKRAPEPAPARAPAAADPAPPRIERASRQTILATPARPNHPRQLLIQPATAPEPPKILPPLPNIVEWGASAQPVRPRTSISRETLARLLPKARKRRTTIEAVAPALPNQELRIAPLSMASNVPVIARPRMTLPAAAAPTSIQRRDLGEAAAAPELNQAAPGGTNGDSGRGIIALSANPAPAPPSLDVPLGNLSARVAVSPLGPTPGPDAGTLGGNGKNAAGGNGDGAGGNSAASGSGNSSGGGGSGGPAEIFIAKGDPSKTSNIVGPGSGSGSGSGLAPPRAGSPGANPSPRLSSRDLALGAGRGGVPMPPAGDAGALGGYTPTRPEEAVLRQKRIYTVAVNMPNLTSVTGSWVLKFAELDSEGNKTGRAPGGELSSPEAIRKVDPKYPPALVEARIEGDVVLYAIIRKDGTVDSVHVLRSLEPELDRNAMNAFTRWQFWPAIKAGTPVDIETVVTIPFRAFVPR